MGIGPTSVPVLGGAWVLVQDQESALGADRWGQEGQLFPSVQLKKHQCAQFPFYSQTPPILRAFQGVGCGNSPPAGHVCCPSLPGPSLAPHSTPLQHCKDTSPGQLCPSCRD